MALCWSALALVAGALIAPTEPTTATLALSHPRALLIPSWDRLSCQARLSGFDNWHSERKSHYSWGFEFEQYVPPKLDQSQRGALARFSRAIDRR